MPVTKEDLNYDKMSPDDQKVIDVTRNARDECVSWNGKGDKFKPAKN